MGFPAASEVLCSHQAESSSCSKLSLPAYVPRHIADGHGCEGAQVSSGSTLLVAGLSSGQAGRGPGRATSGRRAGRGDRSVPPRYVLPSFLRDVKPLSLCSGLIINNGL